MSTDYLGGICGACGQPRATHGEGCPVAGIAIRSSQEALAQAAPAPRSTPQVAQRFSEGEVSEMEANARRWMSGPEGNAELKGYLLETSLVLLQLKRQLALNPPGGRSGNTVQSKSIMDFMELAEQMMRVVAQAEKKGEEVQA